MLQVMQLNIKDNTTLGLIDVSEDIKPIVLEDLRDKYLK